MDMSHIQKNIASVIQYKIGKQAFLLYTFLIAQRFQIFHLLEPNNIKIMSEGKAAYRRHSMTPKIGFRYRELGQLLETRG
jgi:hypothetical protein